MKKIGLLLKNPFAVLSDKQILLTGVVAFVIGVFLAFQFQIQLQILRINTLKIPNLLEVVIGHLIIIICLTVSFFILGKVINKKTRFIDILSSVLISLIPLYISLFQNINGFLSNETSKIENAVKDGTIYTQTPPFLLIIVGLIGFCFFIYYIYLLFVGFKTATNAKKIWHYLLFFVILIAIDLLTSGLINSI
ncbi:hypothetical protein H1R17_13980 [Flavobacterium sp. xlx-214]|uniref:YIP1 family protein n=1 Tax=unclassified Flavobacterium TaxID=196869 RepID=UPI0013D0D1B5|nr:MULTISPECIES: YIP1 family protein [unclassified Flavobacterium]MBA5791296.1 hypothetical protein [Flavobacterium sp. xlx-221]QMI83545.1 hypothetical protein H1R17_13980 [Flavobacterium sp. xlx-214]